MAFNIRSNTSFSSLSDWVEASDPAQQVTVLSDRGSSNDSSTTSHENWINEATTDTIRMCLIARDEKIAKLEQELYEKADAIDMLKRNLRLEKTHCSRTIAQQEQEVKAGVDILAQEHMAELAALNRDWEIEYLNQTRYFEDRLDSQARDHEAELTALDVDWEIECADKARQYSTLLSDQAAACAEQRSICSLIHEQNLAAMACHLRNQEAWYEAELERMRARHEAEKGRRETRHEEEAAVMKASYEFCLRIGDTRREVQIGEVEARARREVGEKMAAIGPGGGAKE